MRNYTRFVPLHDDSKARTLGAVILLALGTVSPAGAAPVTAEAPKALPSPAVIAPKASSLVIKVSPDAIVAENVRATAALYAASTLEEMKLFDVVDRLVDAFQSGRLPVGAKGSGDRLAAYAKGRPGRLTKSTREELTRFASETVRSELDQRLLDTNQELEAYGALVRRVSETLERFAHDNVSDNQGRDSLADRFPNETAKSASDLARSLSNHGYGASYAAASELQQQMREMMTLLRDPALQAAYGARSEWELIDKLGGKPAPEAERIQRRAEAGARLIESLADNAALFDAPNRRAELLRRLAGAAPHAKAWAAAKPARVPQKVAPKLVRPLCFDDKHALVPCTLTR